MRNFYQLAELHKYKPPEDKQHEWRLVLRHKIEFMMRRNTTGEVTIMKSHVSLLKKDLKNLFK